MTKVISDIFPVYGGGWGIGAHVGRDVHLNRAVRVNRGSLGPLRGRGLSWSWACGITGGGWFLLCNGIIMLEVSPGILEK